MAPATQKTEWKLPELAEEAGVSPRTVRYYVQRGLLPAPAFRGRDTVYEAEHLVRLKAIKRLQDRFLPLDAIQVELARLSPEQLKELAEGTDAPVLLVGPTVPPTARHPGQPLPPVWTPSSTPSSTPSPAPPPPPTPPPARWERWELLPGLELHLSEGADAATRALAERLRTQVEQDKNGGAP